MLYFRTGKPGHGKTLNTIREVDAYAFKSGRSVYYHNINGLQANLLKANWFEFENPQKWFELPENAIIVIDEAQNWFRSPDPRARPPEHITRFEVMRHSGHEVHLITQDPRYLDAHLRRLANGHIHYWRVFKSTKLIRFESESVIEKVEVKSSFKDCDKTTLSIDSSFFDVYKSSNAEHHFKTKIPKKFIIAVGFILFVGLGIFLAYKKIKPEPLAPEPVESVSSKSSSSFTAAPTADKPRKTKREFYADRVPRMPDLPSSAPLYDDLTKPVAYPKLYCLSTSDPALVARRPSSSVRGDVSCQCYTQQGTKVNTNFDFCLSMVSDGYFDASIPDRGSFRDGVGSFQASVSGQPMPQVSLSGDSSSSDIAGSARVTVIPYQKDQFLW